MTTQIRWIKKRGGDDFNELMVDSTAVTANSAWPTDSKIIIGLLVRIWRKLDRMTLMTEKDAAQILEILADVNKLDFQINMVGGKKGAEDQRKELYVQFMDLAEAAFQTFGEALGNLSNEVKLS